MATLQAATASNAPVLAPDSVAAVEAILDDYDFIGTVADLRVTIGTSKDDEPYLAIYGFAAFGLDRPLVSPFRGAGRSHTHDSVIYFENYFIKYLSPDISNRLES